MLMTSTIDVITKVMNIIFVIQVYSQVQQRMNHEQM